MFFDLKFIIFIQVTLNKNVSDNDGHNHKCQILKNIIGSLDVIKSNAPPPTTENKAVL